MDIDKAYQYYKQKREKNKEIICMKIFKEEQNFRDVTNENVYLIQKDEQILMCTEKLEIDNRFIKFKEGK